MPPFYGNMLTHQFHKETPSTDSKWKVLKNLKWAFWERCKGKSCQGLKNYSSILEFLFRLSSCPIMVVSFWRRSFPWHNHTFNFCLFFLDWQQRYKAASFYFSGFFNIWNQNQLKIESLSLSSFSVFLSTYLTD